jgi:hypothetical protein
MIHGRNGILELLRLQETVEWIYLIPLCWIIMSDRHFMRHHADLANMIISLKASRTSFPFSLTTNPWNPLRNPGLWCVNFLAEDWGDSCDRLDRSFIILEFVWLSHFVDFLRIYIGFFWISHVSLLSQLCWSLFSSQHIIIFSHYGSPGYICHFSTWTNIQIWPLHTILAKHYRTGRLILIWYYSSARHRLPCWKPRHALPDPNHMVF